MSGSAILGEISSKGGGYEQFSYGQEVGGTCVDSCPSNSL